MKKNEKIVVLGASGLVGGAILKKLLEKGYGNLIGVYSKRRPGIGELKGVEFKQLNLLDQFKTLEFFKTYKPDYIFFVAAKVGGILANNTYKANFIYENMAIALNTIYSAYKFGVKKLLNLGSSCIYPKFAPQPMKEEHLLTGELEPTNEPYAIAKISAIKLCRYYNEQYKTNFISAMPTNLYGPNDNFNLEASHVLPALIRKFHLAKLLEQGNFEGIKRDFKKHTIGFGLDEKVDFNDNNSIIHTLSQLGIKYSFKDYTNQPQVTVTLWGSGEVYREFLYVEDLAEACIYLMENVDAYKMREFSKDYFVNVGTGKDVKIKDLAYIIKDIVGFKGDIAYDSTKPNGTPRKLLDISKIKQIGWEARTDLKEGIKKTYEWYIS